MKIICDQTGSDPAETCAAVAAAPIASTVS